ncbi:MAG: signal peptidase I [Hyphomicrobiales bacterium]
MTSIAVATRLVRRTAGNRWVVRVVSAAFFGAAYAILGLVFFLAILPRVSGFEVRRVISGSMEPGIQVNDLSVTRAVDPATLRVGDVILFDDPDSSTPSNPRVVLHRIVKVDHEAGDLGFETKGDNNPEGDAWVVPAANVHGKLLFHVPYAGHLLVVLGSKFGYFAFVVVPGLIIMIPELLFIIRWILHGEEAEKQRSVEAEAVA